MLGNKSGKCHKYILFIVVSSGGVKIVGFFARKLARTSFHNPGQILRTIVQRTSTFLLHTQSVCMVKEFDSEGKKYKDWMNMTKIYCQTKVLLTI